MTVKSISSSICQYYFFSIKQKIIFISLDKKKKEKKGNFQIVFQQFLVYCSKFIKNHQFILPRKKNETWMLKSPSKETLCDSSERKSPEQAPPSSIIWRSLRSRSEASAAKSNSEKNGPCNTVLTQCTAQSFDSCTSWYSIPPLLAPSIIFQTLELVYVCVSLCVGVGMKMRKKKQKCSFFVFVLMPLIFIKIIFYTLNYIFGSVYNQLQN